MFALHRPIDIARMHHSRHGAACGLSPISSARLATRRAEICFIGRATGVVCAGRPRIPTRPRCAPVALHVCPRQSVRARSCAQLSTAQLSAVHHAWLACRLPTGGACARACPLSSFVYLLVRRCVCMVCRKQVSCLPLPASHSLGPIGTCIVCSFVYTVRHLPTRKPLDACTHAIQLPQAARALQHTLERDDVSGKRAARDPPDPGTRAAKSADLRKNHPCYDFCHTPSSVGCWKSRIHIEI